MHLVGFKLEIILSTKIWTSNTEISCQNPSKGTVRKKEAQSGEYY